MAIFSERIKELRLERNMSQITLASVLNVSDRMIRYYEQGTKMPELEVLISLATLFSVSVDYLLGRSDKRNL